MISELKDWNQTRKRRAAMALFLKLYQDKESTMQGILNEAAYKMAREMFMRMLDAEGFMHCKLCPVRGPLKRLIQTGDMLCELHYKLVLESHEKLKSTKPKGDSHAPASSTGSEEAARSNSPADPSAV